jgi:flagellar basal body-associated protein FliL
MPKKKLLIPLVLVLVLGVGYTMTKSKKTVVSKIAGTIYVMPQTFLANLSEGHYAKLSVALQLAPGQSTGGAGAAPASGEGGAGTLPEEPLIREIVTNTLTGQDGATLTSEQGRTSLKRRILSQILARTDVKVEAVVIPEITVQ